MSRDVTINGVKLTIAKDYEEMSLIAARMIYERLEKKPDLNLLVPTGTTPKRLYEILSIQSSSIFMDATFFNFDEYCVEEHGIVDMVEDNHPASYRKYMNDNFFYNMTISPSSFFPTLENGDEPGVYDRLIESKGGIDLCINAMGMDGHTFGFNSPAKGVFETETRLLKVANSTQEVNAKLTGLKTPTWCVTTGITTGMKSKEVIFLVNGKRKSEILQKVIFSDVTEDIPATILKTHSNCHWIIDEEAASKLFYEN